MRYGGGNATGDASLCGARNHLKDHTAVKHVGQIVFARADEIFFEPTHWRWCAWLIQSLWLQVFFNVFGAQKRKPLVQALGPGAAHFVPASPSARKRKRSALQHGQHASFTPSARGLGARIAVLFDMFLHLPRHAFFEDFDQVIGLRSGLRAEAGYDHRQICIALPKLKW